MPVGRFSHRETTSSAVSVSGLTSARQILRRQLDTLRRLASAAVRLVDEATRRVVPDLGGIGALEKAVRLHGKVAWALRLIEALRAKLVDDLGRVERGEAPELVLARLAPASEVAKDELPPALAVPRDLPDSEGREPRERLESENFGRFFSRRSDDEFTEILRRPADEVIALICRELGLSPEWLRHVEEAWEGEEVSEETASRFSSPFPLDGGRVGDGGGAVSGKPPPS